MSAQMREALRMGIQALSEYTDTCEALAAMEAALSKTEVERLRGEDSCCPEDEAERFIQAAIDQAPEPLRRLGEYLTKALHEDQWPTAESMLLAIATAQPVSEDMAKDAARYRWLRRLDAGGIQVYDGNNDASVFGGDLDTAIDAAMLAAAPEVTHG